VKQKLLEEFASMLRRKRNALLQAGAPTIADVPAITAERQSELEESAQNEGITRVLSHLRERDRQTIREIDAALDRIAAGVYGECVLCENEIGVNRLRALPMTTFCIECATTREKQQQSINAARSATSRDAWSAATLDEFDAAETEG
jgi:DnaK suppressor protein